MTTTQHPLRRARGFTALELAAVLAVTAVVAALGVSAYRTYAVRAEIAAAVATAAAVQRHVERAFAASGHVPTTHEAGTALTAIGGSLIGSLEIVAGRIELRFGPAADEAIAGKTLSLTPFETADQRIVWLCGNRAPDAGLEPLGFLGGGPQPVQVVTAIEPRYLPTTCR